MANPELRGALAQKPAKVQSKQGYYYFPAFVGLSQYIFFGINFTSYFPRFTIEPF